MNPRHPGLRSPGGVALTLAAAVVALTWLGCGADQGHPPVYPVKGKVTLKGKPLTEGYVVYELEESSGAKSSSGESTAGPLRVVGPIRSDGTFRLNAYPGIEGMPEGRYKVGISSRAGRSEGGLFDADRKIQKGNPDVLGARYADPKTSGLTDQVVKDKTNEPSFDLSVTATGSRSRRS